MDTDAPLKDAVRIADEGIYLNEDRYDKPKELFKEIGRLIKSYGLPEDFHICDVGCATGEFLYYITTRFPKCIRAGLDISPNLVAAAKKALPDTEFIVGSITGKNSFRSRQYDVMTCIGILPCLDDPAPALLNLLSATKKGGKIIVAGAYNEDPIDVVMRYRRADQDESPWESGWNIPSCHTMEKILRESGYAVEVGWRNFTMPFPVERRADPMRSWTTQVGPEPHFLINGACQLLHMKILQVSIHDVP